MPAVEFFASSDRARMAQALALRTRVFVIEQGVPPSIEVDEHDRAGSLAVHALLAAEGRYIGTGRFYELDAATVQIGRMAVEAFARGRGAGAVLLRALGDEARRRGYVRAHLHAQVHARAFYLRAGYADDGEQRWDNAILHQPMSRTL